MWNQVKSVHELGRQVDISATYDRSYARLAWYETMYNVVIAGTIRVDIQFDPQRLYIT